MDGGAPHILLVEDDESHADLIRRAFESGTLRADLTVTKTLAQAQASLAKSLPELAIVDLILPDGKGTELLPGHKRRGFYPVVVITAHGDEQTAVEAMKAGALDYVVKSPATLAEMPRIAEQALLQWEHVNHRRRAEDALRQSEQRYRRITAAVTDYIYTVRVQGGQAVETIHRPTSAAVIGYSPEELAADPELWIRMVPEEDRPAVFEQASRVLSGESFEPLEHRIVRKDGAVRWVRNTPVPHYDAQGNLIAYDGLIRDITEQKQAETALRESNVELRGIYDAMADGLVIADVDTKRLLRVNTAACRILGYGEDELLSMSVMDIHPPRELPDILETFIALAEGRLSVAENVPFLRKDKTVFYADLTSAGKRFDYHQRLATALVVRDITKRKWTEEELAKAKRAAEAADRAKSQFLANMSHEIRTPMTAILGYADLLRASEPPPEERETYLETIHRNGQILLQLINDILDLSKIDANKIAIEPVDCSPWRIVEQVVSLLRGRAAEKGLSLEVEYAFPLPEGIRTDPVRLQQILVNLVGNSIKFTEQGGVRVAVRCTGPDTAAPRMQFAVSDTGPGMTAEEAVRLFEPFARAAAARGVGGTGLGLAISKRLAGLLGGDIDVQSRPGEGSTFTLTVNPGPLRGAAMLQAPPSAAAAEPEPATPEPRPVLHGRLLLADDDRDTQRLLGLVLATAGLEVDAAENGRTACRMAEASQAEGRPYDLILMDIEMPEMDGYQATAELRRSGWQGPIVALTAHAMAGEQQKCLAAGCDDYISKPIEQSGLLAAIARNLGQAPDPR